MWAVERGDGNGRVDAAASDLGKAVILSSMLDPSVFWARNNGAPASGEFTGMVTGG